MENPKYLCIHLLISNIMKTKKCKILDCFEFDKLVTRTYGKRYCFQQQDDCKDRGTEYFSVPHPSPNEEEMHDEIPEKVNGDQMGVKFPVWLARDPKQPLKGQNHDYELELFWERNFYPDFGTLVNDLHSKGLLKAGEYGICIDW